MKAEDRKEAKSAVEQAAVDRIAEMNGGVVTPELVVAHSRDPDSPLHERFLWGRDDEAARRWRQEEARRVIRACVVMVSDQRGKDVTIRAYESLSNERHTTGGYRSVVQILSNEDMREQLLRDALSEFRAFQTRYKKLAELAPLFAKADEVFGAA